MSEFLTKWKVFLCYAREDQVLLSDFFDRFHNYNARDMNILYDKNETDENMHEVFSRYAEECDVAVLLVNARLLDNEHYANMNEIPILKERRDRKEVILVGVRLSNVRDLEDWNSNGDIYFFPITNNDLPNTRSKNITSQRFLQEFAVYKQIDEKDLDDYHDRLRKWIKDNIRKKFGDSNVLRPHMVRSTDETKKILTMMNFGSLIYSLEEKLSNDISHWKEAGIAPPVSGESYAFWYCLCQADRYEDIEEQLLDWDRSDPLKKFWDIYKTTRKKNESIKRLLDDGSSLKEDTLGKQLDRLELVLNQAQEEILRNPRNSHFEVKSKLITAIRDLREEFKLIGGSSLGGS